ncbi:vitamin K epoxide reductase family protein [Flavobacterium silvaticum]|uniref:Thioredoxin domain-containing protein n=1 Tax=Flavobacterium silvaticum TaxID=1852020 RepID=A0A972FUT4_9FLAO|nr:vitamin K epoxide reductase family protein [Flavobacterium silvaticum]NMH28010.1 thioredoxin domain-containing protein [Flavobacterium silvaticum]
MEGFRFIKEFLAKLHYREAEETLLQFRAHPEFPNLFAFSQTLDFMGIPAFIGTIQKEDFAELPDIFLSVIESDTGKELVYTRRKRNVIEVEFSNGFKKKLNVQEFLSAWTGIVAVVNQNTSDENSSNRLAKPLLLFAAVTGFVSVLFQNDFSVLPVLFYVLSSIGALFSYWLIGEETGIKNDTVSRVCAIGKKTECSSVVASGFGKFGKKVSASVLSFWYFLSIVVILVFIPVKSITLLAVIVPVCMIPVVLYSWYTQAFTIKKWCVLCLGVSAVLVLQALCSVWIYNYWPLTSSGISQSLSVLFLLAGIYYISMAVKSGMRNRVERNWDLLQNQKMKKNPIVFKALLSSWQPVDVSGLDEDFAIVAGNPDAPVSITAVVSTSCENCHKTVTELLSLVESNPQECKARFVLNAHTASGNELNMVYETILEYNRSGKQEQAISALKDWHFNQIGLKAWVKKWSVADTKSGIEALEYLFSWCMETGVFFTPAVIVEGHLLGEPYSARDLAYFIDELAQTKLVS